MNTFSLWQGPIQPSHPFYFHTRAGLLLKWDLLEDTIDQVAVPESSQVTARS